MTIISQQIIKATRKSHKCAGCGSVVAAGSTMERTNEAMDGRLTSAYWCAICVKFMEGLDPYGLADGFTDMWEYDGYKEFRDAEMRQNDN